MGCDFGVSAVSPGGGDGVKRCCEDPSVHVPLWPPNVLPSHQPKQPLPCLGHRFSFGFSAPVVQGDQTVQH